MIGCEAVHIHLKLHLPQKIFIFTESDKNLTLIQNLIKMKNFYIPNFNLLNQGGQSTASGHNPVREALFMTAKQIHSPVFPCQSHFNPVNYIIAKGIICNNGRDDDLFFGDYLFIGLHNTISNAPDRYFLPTLS